MPNVQMIFKNTHLLLTVRKTLKITFSLKLIE